MLLVLSSLKAYLMRTISKPVNALHRLTKLTSIDLLYYKIRTDFITALAFLIITL